MPFFAVSKRSALTELRPPPLTGDRASSAPLGTETKAGATALSDDEVRLAQSLKRHFQDHPRMCRRPSISERVLAARAARRQEPAVTEVEEVSPVEDVETDTAWLLLVPPPLPGEVDAGDAVGGAEEPARRGPPPVWINARRRPSLRARLASTFAWTTTLLIVMSVVGGAIVGLIGYQRSLGFAEVALARLVDFGRALGLIHA